MLCLDEESSLHSQKYILCLDVVQIICDFCDLKTQINLIKTCKEYEENLKIKKLTCTDIINSQITQNILQQKKFDQLRCLNVWNNKKITSVNHLKDTLLELDCSCVCGIRQEGINDLRKLQKLNVFCNNNITNVNHLKDTLIELYCGGSCGIRQKGINELRNLQKLYTWNNKKITNVNHLKDTLLELDCGYDCGYNNNRYDDNSCGMRQEGINELRKLLKLDAGNNEKITNVNHLKDTLIELNCSYNCGIQQEGINELRKLQKLITYNNIKIININMCRTNSDFKTLKKIEL